MNQFVGNHYVISDQHAKNKSTLQPRNDRWHNFFESIANYFINYLVNNITYTNRSKIIYHFLVVLFGDKSNKSKVDTGVS